MKRYKLEAFSITEIRPLSVKVLDLQAAETVSTATAVHTPPSGSAVTITPTVATPYVNMLAGPFTAIGRHYILVKPVGSAGSKPTVQFVFDVE